MLLVVSVLKVLGEDSLGILSLLCRCLFVQCLLFTGGGIFSEIPNFPSPSASRFVCNYFDTSSMIMSEMDEMSLDVWALIRD